MEDIPLQVTSNMTPLRCNSVTYKKGLRGLLLLGLPKSLGMSQHHFWATLHSFGWEPHLSQDHPLALECPWDILLGPPNHLCPWPSDLAQAMYGFVPQPLPCPNSPQLFPMTHHISQCPRTLPNFSKHCLMSCNITYPPISLL
jgi:hypothetical protein